MPDDDWKDGVRRTLTRHEQMLWAAVVGIVGASITFGGILYAQGTERGTQKEKVDQLEKDQGRLEGKVEDYQETQQQIFQTLGRIEGKLDRERVRDSEGE